MTTYTGWFTGSNFYYDMAVIKLNSPIGFSTGWLGMMPSNIFSNPLNAIGYPGDKTYATQWYYYCPSVSDLWPFDSVTKNTCDIFPGQSGSGNYVKNSKGNRYIRAITSYQTCTCYNPSCSICGAPYANYFQQLTSTRFSAAKSWAGIP
jgi:V8-like Glu-specific endopeptidase